MDVRFSIELPREAYTVAVMREFLGEALRTSGIGDDCVFRILLATSEACANIVDHGAPAPGYEVAVRVEDDSCVVDITHRGPEFTAAQVPLPEPEAESGRGILLMRQLVDDVSYTASSAGTAVRLRTWLRGTDLAHAGSHAAVAC